MLPNLPPPPSSLPAFSPLPPLLPSVSILEQISVLLQNVSVKDEQASIRLNEVRASTACQPLTERVLHLFRALTELVDSSISQLLLSRLDLKAMKAEYSKIAEDRDLYARIVQQAPSQLKSSVTHHQNLTVCYESLAKLHEDLLRRHSQLQCELVQVKSCSNQLSLHESREKDLARYFYCVLHYSIAFHFYFCFVATSSRPQIVSLNSGKSMPSRCPNTR
jgi:hypothetical protein